jgi:glycosyltransferase involved in cell wall biosynthesis
MPTPAVSVVMPAYNHERFIAETIESVLCQTFDDLELVIVDDGSTDGTAEVIARFSDPRINYHYQYNQDAFNALNNGIEMARGEYIAIINSDDVYLPTRLERLVTACSDGARFAFTDVEPINDDGASLAGTGHPWNAWHRGNREFYFEDNDLYRGFLHGNFMVTTSNIFMARELAERVGPFAPIRYLHDYDYVFRLLLEAEPDTLYLEDEKLLKYRIHAGNTLSEAAVIGREQDREIIRRYLLARLPTDTHRYAETGIDRLIALEHELIDVRRQVRQERTPSAPAPRPLARRILGRIRRTLRHGL